MSPCEPTSTAKVFEAAGLLEEILAFSDVPDLLVATAVSKRWKEAGRADFLWEKASLTLYKDKIAAPQQRRDTNGELVLPFFWRSLFHKDAIQRMTMNQVKTMFQHPILQIHYQSTLEKLEGRDVTEFQRFVQVYMLDVVSDTQQHRKHIFYRDLWFGSYSCSVVDAARHHMKTSEVVSNCGFEAYFKIAEDEVMDQEDLEELEVYPDEPGIRLYQHSTCFFKEDHDFIMEMKDAELFSGDMKWRWVEEGKVIQVGPYPSLNVSRMDDWGWKLENVHVVFFARDARNFSL
mmetsp:Transcript_4722/g.7010  ORF Transcript_4722/g.7010 Transcript_4722/m.7010 type:complete len:290 (+) Transcript_4722:14-883(+)